MIDARELLLSDERLTAAQAAALVGEMESILNTIQVKLRDAGYATGNVCDNTVAGRLLTAWGALYEARPLILALREPEQAEAA